MFLLKINSSDQDSIIEENEKRFNVKNIKDGPVFRKSVSYGKHNTTRDLIMVKCRLSEKKSKTNTFDVHIILHRIPHWYYVVRSSTPRTSGRSCDLVVSLVKNVKLPEDKNFIRTLTKKLCCEEGGRYND